MKTNDWSINLEDPYYEENHEALLNVAVQAVKNTASGYYVNVVAPSSIEEPEHKLIPEIVHRLQQEGVSYKNIRYVDQCGCGGHVIRVFL